MLSDEQFQLVLNQLADMRRPLSLAGKDFFSVEEAAHYCCISRSQFYSEVAPHVRGGRFAGRVVYRRDDLQKLVEMQGWPHLPSAVSGLSLPRGRGKPHRPLA